MTSAAETSPIVIRDLDAIDEIKALEDLQIEVWGDGERDVVPLSQFVAARYVGGSLVGAFDRERLVGFAYGFYGHVRGRIVHHSHMLAVRSEYRSHDLGFRLKAKQRENVLADGLSDRMTWTFDPLQSVNAHFNFAKLGVVSDTYKINVYGEEGASFLHQNGTDRLFVTWLLNSSRVQRSVADQGRAKRGRDDYTPNAPRLLQCSELGEPIPTANIDAALSESTFAEIAIPADINTMENADFGIARKWREETRRIFTEALSKGYVVVDYSLENERSGYYLLEKTQLDQLT